MSDDWHEIGDLELTCDRCGQEVMEGYRRDADDLGFWCSKKCMAADGHDATNAYATVSELGLDEGMSDDPNAIAQAAYWQERAGRLSDELRDVEAERDRLRAVAEAARRLLTAIDSTIPGRLLAGIEGRAEVAMLREELDALSGDDTLDGKATDV